MTAAYRAVAGRIRQDLDDIAAISGRARAIWINTGIPATNTMWMPLP